MIGRLWNWCTGHRLSVLSATLLCMGAAICFIVVSYNVLDGSTQAFDDRLILVLRNPNDIVDPIGPPWLEEAGRDMTALGGVTVLTTLSISVVGFFWLSGKDREMWLLLFAAMGGIMLSSWLKLAFDRPRPDLVPHDSYVHTSSFPSGHSLMSAVVYLALAIVIAESVSKKRHKFYCAAVAITLVLLIGVSRIYMGVHYLTDVLAGWSAGLFWVMLCWLAGQWLRRKPRDQ